MNNKGVQSIGIRLPIIKQGDDLKKIVVDAVLDATAVYNNGYDFSNDEPFWYDIQDKDVIGITESVVARSQGNYVTINDIVEFLRLKNYKKRLELYCPIMSRNRFSMILKAFARYADKINLNIDGSLDEQGNPTSGVNPFTGINIIEYYKEICESENCELTINEPFICEYSYIDCQCHPEINENTKYFRRLSDIMTEPIKRADGTISGYNADWGLLGSNKANEESLKLFPKKKEAQELVESIQDEILRMTKKKVEVMIYGDGCFKSPEYNGISIWEFADPVTSPAYTKELEGTPNEIKIKAFADDQYCHLEGKMLEEAIKKEVKNHKNTSLVGSMASQGTTPRRYVDLLASLMDLTSGSGDKGTPVVLVKNYFCKYSD